MKIKTLTAIVISLSMITGCGSQKDADKVGDAQTCIDNLSLTATTAEINACAEKIDGMTTTGAEGIRCTVGFLREGFANGKRFLDAVHSIDSGTGGSSTQNLMGLLSFSSAGAVAQDYENVSSTFNSCVMSGGKGATLLASFSYVTLGLMKYFVAKGGCADTRATSTDSSYQYYDLGQCIVDTANYIAADPLNRQDIFNDLKSSSSGDSDAASAQSGIGAVIVATYQLSCAGSGSSKDLCKILSDAIDAAGGPTNPRAVAVGLITSLLP